MNKPGYSTIAFPIPTELKEKVSKPVELWRNLSKLFSELAAAAPNWNQLKEKYPLAYELLKVMP